jgi:(1->4)-alpha-D-glucan 1-alpha-D-glucosylmutase
VPRWSRWLSQSRRSVDLNEQYFYLQNLLGAWPLNADEFRSFRERMKNYSTKAAREAREYTNWLSPNEEHERDLRTFIDALFENARFLSSFLPLQQKAALYGAVNSLAQTLLKITAPGLPDFYRGTVGWDLSLVDPDNRRPVAIPQPTDFAERARSFLAHWQDGTVKTFLTERALCFRKAHSDLFAEGDYTPVQSAGKRADHVFAFARQNHRTWSITAVPRLAGKLATAVRFPTGMLAWRDTRLLLPAGAPSRWRNVLTGARLQTAGGELVAARVFDHFPVALLVAS